MTSPDNPTTDGLLAALRRHTNRPAMGWAVPPAPLAGGFWAEMYAVQLSDPPPELEGRLVARIMPDPATAAFETAVQRHLTRCRFPVPSIRCADGPSSDLDRAWSLMDFAAGQPLLAGLRTSTAIKQAPTLLRRLPDLLADAAATLHHCPLDGLDSELAGHTRQPDIHDFLERIAAHADAIGRHDLGPNSRTPRRYHARHAGHLPRRSPPVQPARRRRPVDADRLVLSRRGRPPLRPRVHHADARQPSPRRTRTDPGRRPARSAHDSPSGSCAPTNSEPVAPSTPPGSPGVAAPTRCAPSSRSRHGKPPITSTRISDIPG